MVRPNTPSGMKMPPQQLAMPLNEGGEVMATWQRLYYECVALLFAGSLYLRRFAGGSSRRRRKLVEVCQRTQLISKGQVQSNVEEVKPFPAVERRRNPAVPSQHREAGEIAIFQELGKALTSSLQLDQVLRTIMEKIA